MEGTTRIIKEDNGFILKMDKEGFNENRKAIRNYKLFRHLGVLNRLDNRSTDEILICDKCIPIPEYLGIKNTHSMYMDTLARENQELEELGYWDKREILLRKTNLSFDEYQVPDNWGIDMNGELVVIDYSR